MNKKTKLIAITKEDYNLLDYKPKINKLGTLCGLMAKLNIIADKGGLFLGLFLFGSIIK